VPPRGVSSPPRLSPFPYAGPEHPVDRFALQVDDDLRNVKLPPATWGKEPSAAPAVAEAPFRRHAMPKYALTVALALLLAGCTGSTWVRPNTSELQRQQDLAACQGADSQANHTERTCMERMGYRLDRGG
jgi:hypothetical protein